MVICVFAVVGFAALWVALRSDDRDRFAVLPPVSTERDILADLLEMP
jgi:hypothetical protein